MSLTPSMTPMSTTSLDRMIPTSIGPTTLEAAASMLERSPSSHRRRSPRMHRSPSRSHVRRSRSVSPRRPGHSGGAKFPCPPGMHLRLRRRDGKPHCTR